MYINSNKTILHKIVKNNNLFIYQNPDKNYSNNL